MNCLGEKKKKMKTKRKGGMDKVTFEIQATEWMSKLG